MTEKSKLEKYREIGYYKINYQDINNISYWNGLSWCITGGYNGITLKTFDIVYL
jgi:hypothetical protein